MVQGLGGGWRRYLLKREGGAEKMRSCEPHTGYRSAYIFWLSSGQKHRDVVARLVPIVAIESGTQGVGHFDPLLNMFGLLPLGLLHPRWLC